MYNVGIIGVGKIASYLDTPEADAPYCHSGGIRLSKKVRLAAVADISPVALEAFQTLWGAYLPDVHQYGSAAEMLASENLDIVTICVRGPDHFDMAMQVLDHAPKAIFLEKPPSCSLDQMDQMVVKAKEKGTSVTVSYTRHWTPHIMRLQELVEEGIIGKVEQVVGYTGRPLVSYGGHTTDLICQFAGYCPKSVFATASRMEPAPEGFESEPHLGSMTIEFENGVTGFQIPTSGGQGDFYCEIYGTKGVVHAGMYIPPMIRLWEEGVLDNTKLGFPENRSVFTCAYDEIADYLGGGRLPNCTGERFTIVNEIGYAAVESIYTGNRIALPNQNRNRKIHANW
jgi:predicted dehydrogenase